MYLGNAFSVNVMYRGWERKVVYCTHIIRFAIGD